MEMVKQIFQRGLDSLIICWSKSPGMEKQICQFKQRVIYLLTNIILLKIQALHWVKHLQKHWLTKRASSDTALYYRWMKPMPKSLLILEDAIGSFGMQNLQEKK